MVVGVEGLHGEEAPEKVVRQVGRSQWSDVVPHWGALVCGLRVGVWGNIYPSVLATALSGSAFLVAIVRSTVSRQNTRDQREESDGRDTHYDYEYMSSSNELSDKSQIKQRCDAFVRYDFQSQQDLLIL